MNQLETATKRGAADFLAGKDWRSPYQRRHLRIAWDNGYALQWRAAADACTSTAAQLPNARRALQGRRSDGTLYLEGLTIAGGPHVSLTIHRDFIDIQKAEFSGWNPAAFHYCPVGNWSEWVMLAKNILAIDSALSSQERQK